jgi:protein-tyrosine phosphatase
MTEIKPYQLWVGHAGDGRDFRRLFDAGIQAVVDLAFEEAPATLPREFIYLRIPLVDGGGNPAKVLTLAVHSLAKLLQMHVPTLVVCGAGLSRAPSVAAAALAITHRESPEACLQKVIAHHPHDVAPGFWQELVVALEHQRVGA